MKSFKRHTSVFEKAAFIVMLLLFILSAIVQLFYSGGAAMLLTASFLCTVILAYLIFLPLRYEFGDESLKIVYPKPFYSKELPYKDMLEYSIIGAFWVAKIDFDAIEVIVTYKQGNSPFKKSVSCHPKNVQGFVAELQKYCPERE